MTDHRVTLAFTGASGIQYGLRLLGCLLSAGKEVHLVVSQAARVVAGLETDLVLPAGTDAVRDAVLQKLGPQPGNLRVFGDSQWTAPMASGSGAPRQMIVCPCTTGTLSAIAGGASDNLLERAADVVIKEGGKLVLVVRESPLSAIHLENMLKLARLGVVILPASPGFYSAPASVEDMIDFVVARILDQLGVSQSLMQPWPGKKSAGENAS